MEDYSQDFDNYDLQNVPDAPPPPIDNYDSYDFGGAGQGGFQGAADIMESISTAGVDISSWWGPPASAASATQTGTSAAMTVEAPAPGAPPASSGPNIASSFEKFLSGAGSFVDKYKTPLEMLGRGVAAAAKSKNDEKAAQRVSNQRMAELNKNYELRANEMTAADQMKHNAAGRYSDSVKGLRVGGGLINSGKLARKDGSQVYGNNGLINRG